MPKEFDLEKAKAGHPLVTRSGLNVVSFHYSGLDVHYPCCAYIQGRNEAYSWTTAGGFITTGPRDFDLFLADPPKVKKEAYLVAFRSSHTLFSALFTKKESIANYMKHNPELVMCGEIIYHTWEEEAP